MHASGEAIGPLLEGEALKQTVCQESAKKRNERLLIGNQKI
jgi:hypothetical protein